MNKYIFCVNNEKYMPPCAGFWPINERDLYPDTFPDIGVEVDEVVKEKYSGAAPEGKKLGADSKGFPTWIRLPPPNKKQSVEQAESKKQSLITEANQKTQLWQTQLMLGIITDEDKASLTAWMLYVQKVQAVDTSTAPDIIWPEKPE